MAEDGVQGSASLSLVPPAGLARRERAGATPWETGCLGMAVSLGFPGAVHTVKVTISEGEGGGEGRVCCIHLTRLNLAG